MKETLTAYIYLTTWRIVRWIPEAFAYQTFSWIADQMNKRKSLEVERLRSNLRRVDPCLNGEGLNRLVQDGLRSYMRYWCDIFRFPDWSVERIQNTVTATREHLLLDAIAAGNGAIVTLPHAGNYDHAAAYFCSKGAKIVTVAEHLKPEALFKKFISFRAAFGMEVLPLDGGVIPTLAQRLRAGCIVALAADRDLSRSGVDVTFFGAPARMPAGPAVLALKTGAPLIYAMVSYTQIGIHIDFEMVPIPTDGSESEKIAAIIQSSADLFAKGIATHPQDWHMLQRIWVDGDFKEHLNA